MKKINMIIQLVVICAIALQAPYSYGASPVQKELTLSITDRPMTSLPFSMSAVLATIYQLIQQGNIYYDQEDYLSAIVSCQEALEKYAQHYKEKSLLLALINHKLGVSYFRIKKYIKSALYFQQALSIGQTCLSAAASSGDDCLKKNICKVIKQTLYHIGSLHLTMGDFQAANQAFKAAFNTESSPAITHPESQLVGNTVSDTVSDIVDDKGGQPYVYQQEKDHQGLYKTALAKQAKSLAIAANKEKGLSQVISKIVGIGGLERSLPPLNMTSFPKLNIVLPHVLQAQQPLSIPPKVSPPLEKEASHKRGYARKKTFACMVCDKKFTQKQHMTIHMRVHTGEKPFACPLCGKNFSVKSNRNKHLRNHTGEKPFLCPLCDKKFALQQHLKKHLRTHTGEKPFACPVCHKKFAQQQNIKIHLRTHTGEKPFSCHICDKFFSIKSNRNKHLRSHTKKKPFPCPFCDKKFAYKYNIKPHIKSIHKNQLLQGTHSERSEVTPEVNGT